MISIEISRRVIHPFFYKSLSKLFFEKNKLIFRQNIFKNLLFTKQSLHLKISRFSKNITNLQTKTLVRHKIFKKRRRIKRLRRYKHVVLQTIRSKIGSSNLRRKTKFINKMRLVRIKLRKRKSVKTRSDFIIFYENHKRYLPGKPLDFFRRFKLKKILKKKTKRLRRRNRGRSKNRPKLGFIILNMLKSPRGGSFVKKHVNFKHNNTLDFFLKKKTPYNKPHPLINSSKIFRPFKHYGPYLQKFN